MFICVDCAPKSLWWLFSLAMGVSYGPCECCHRTKGCIDWHGNLDEETSQSNDRDIDRYDPKD